MRRTRLYNTRTGKWEYWTVSETALHPWRFIRLEALLALRGLRSVLRGARRRTPQVLEFDADTLTMVSPKERRRERFIRTAHAVLSMVDMQKHIG